jgi:DivIVA domain-containing protein
MDIDRQAIERRDFPITRRGYDPAAVDAHLRALASEVEELVRAGGGEPSLASAASSQVQNILQAAETAASEIEREAQERADELRGEADRDARRTREEAIAKAREHVASVTQATKILLERVGSVDGEASAVLGRLREAAERLARDLSALDANMGALYDSASGRARAAAGARGTATPAPAQADAERAGAEAAVSDEAPPAAAAAPAPQADVGTAKADNGDLDGARLVALNMALSGEPRSATERYLAEHFQLAERDKLIDEVYAAIEA